MSLSLFINHGAHGIAAYLNAIRVVVNLADAGIDGTSVILVGNTGATVHDKWHVHTAANVGQNVNVQMGLALIQPCTVPNEQARISEPRGLNEVTRLVRIGIDAPASSAVDPASGSPPSRDPIEPSSHSRPAPKSAHIWASGTGKAQHTFVGKCRTVEHDAP